MGESSEGYCRGKGYIVCGRSVRWWDDEIKVKIEQRRQLYKRMVRGHGMSIINCVVRLSI